MTIQSPATAPSALSAFLNKLLLPRTAAFSVNLGMTIALYSGPATEVTDLIHTLTLGLVTKQGVGLMFLLATFAMFLTSQPRPLQFVLINLPLTLYILTNFAVVGNNWLLAALNDYQAAVISGGLLWLLASSFRAQYLFDLRTSEVADLRRRLEGVYEKLQP